MVFQCDNLVDDGLCINIEVSSQRSNPCQLPVQTCSSFLCIITQLITGMIDMIMESAQPSWKHV